MNINCSDNFRPISHSKIPDKTHRSLLLHPLPCSVSPLPPSLRVPNMVPRWASCDARKTVRGNLHENPSGRPATRNASELYPSDDLFPFPTPFPESPNHNARLTISPDNPVPSLYPTRSPCTPRHAARRLPFRRPPLHVWW